MTDRINRAVEYIRGVTDFEPEIALVLGSGLGEYADSVENSVEIPYADIPGFPVSGVLGHASKFVLGERLGRRVMLMSGRFHYYEGYTQQEAAIAVRVMKKLGVKNLVLTNAAGGVNRSFGEGALMLISDHINYSGGNPLMGPNLEEFGPRFPDMSNVYDRALRTRIKQAAKREGIALEEGVYIFFSGPSYETPAEIRMCAALGADAVGMSTVPEAITANHCGIKVTGISCITNMAAGILDQTLSHAEVFAVAQRVKGEFKRLLDVIIGEVTE